MGSLVRTLNDHLKSEPEPPDLRPSSNVDFPVAWIAGPATDPSLKYGHSSRSTLLRRCTLLSQSTKSSRSTLLIWSNLSNLVYSTPPVHSTQSVHSIKSVHSYQVGPLVSSRSTRL
jgi:hypothetical protein